METEAVIQSIAINQYMSFTQLRDAAEDLTMWSFMECKLIFQELDNWDPEFDKIPMKKITRKGAKRSWMAANNWSGSHSGGEGQ